MKRTIGHTQFAAFVSLTLFVLLITLGLSSWNFETDFREFVTRAEEQRLQALGERLQDAYSAAGGDWQRVDQALLNRLLDAAPPPRRRHHHPPPLPGAQPAQGLSGRSHPPPPKKQRPPPPPKRAPTTLFDAQGLRLAGPPLTETTTGMPVSHTLIDNGAVIGELRSPPRHQFLSREEQGFLAQQRRNRWLVGIVSLIAASLVALVLTRRLQQPLRQTIAAISALSSGDYRSPPLAVEGSPAAEISRLMRDVNQLTERLNQAQSARSRWLADVSHELRTPLTALTGEIEALKDGVRPFDAQRLASIDAQTTRLRTLVEDLYELSLSDMGGLRYQFEPLDLVPLINALAGHMASTTAQAGLNLHLDLPSTALISGDPKRIEQLLVNLLDNACSYTDAPGQIEVRLQHIAGQWQLDVSDSPPGVPQAECDQLFEPLHRREAARDRRHGGAGLGLSIARNIAHAHEAEIGAAPSALGGLRVRVTFNALDPS